MHESEGYDYTKLSTIEALTSGAAACKKPCKRTFFQDEENAKLKITH
jgi:hypothetical protein